MFAKPMNFYKNEMQTFKKIKNSKVDSSENNGFHVKYLIKQDILNSLPKYLFLCMHRT